MRAAVYSSRGAAADVLRVTDVDDPHPKPGEVRVRLRVSGVNPTDWKSRSAGPELAAPQIPNQDGAGDVDEVGEGVDERRIGERVWVYHAAAGRPNGTAAQYTCVPADQAVLLPEEVPYEQGAGLGIPYLTAHRCLLADGPVDGRVVLVTGGAGAVGAAAIQLGAWLGAHVVATVSSAEKAAIARASGAAAVVNYREPDAVDRLREAAPGGVDRVVEVALGANLETTLAILAPHGVVVSYASEATDPTVPVRRLMTGNATLRFVLVYNLTPAMLEHGVSDVTAALRAGALRPLPEHRFALEDIAAAHDAVEGGAVGKVLVEIPQGA
jgi:NADPH:quinone reductase